MIGRSFHHYRIVGEISSSGMGAVYKAEDTKEHRTVALKFFPPGLASDEGAKKRFFGDVEAAAALDHPNICVIHHAGETPGGEIFLSMDYVEGETLEERVLQGSLFIQETVEIAHEIAMGLSYAHGRDVLHRDIKPANVIVTRNGLAKILDFGQAELVERPASEAGGPASTAVAYRSPEQLRGEVVDLRTDIWSLGAVMYELLTGEAPFGGRNDEELARSILNDQPRPITELRPDVSQHLAEIVHKCLNRDRDDRFGSCGEFIQQLKILAGSLRMDRALFSRPLKETPPTGAASTLGRVFWPAASVLTALAIMVAVLVWRGIAPDESPSGGETRLRVAVLPLENRAGGEPGDAFVDGLSETVAETAEDLEFHHPSMQLVPLAPSTPGAPAPEGVHRLLAGSVQRHEGGYQLTLDYLDASSLEPIETRHIAFQEDMSHELPYGVTEALADLLDVAVTPEEQEDMTDACSSDRAYHSYLEGVGLLRQATSDEDIDLAIESLRTSVAADSAFAAAYAWLACACERKGDRRLALRYIESAIRHGFPLEEIRSEPRFRGLRENPRFQEMLRAPGGGSDATEPPDSR